MASSPRIAASWAASSTIGAPLSGTAGSQAPPPRDMLSLEETRARIRVADDRLAAIAKRQAAARNEAEKRAHASMMKAENDERAARRAAMLRDWTWAQSRIVASQQLNSAPLPQPSHSPRSDDTARSAQQDLRASYSTRLATTVASSAVGSNGLVRSRGGLDNARNRYLHTKRSGRLRGDWEWAASKIERFRSLSRSLASDGAAKGSERVATGAAVHASVSAAATQGRAGSTSLRGKKRRQKKKRAWRRGEFDPEWSWGAAQVRAQRSDESHQLASSGVRWSAADASGDLLGGSRVKQLSPARSWRSMETPGGATAGTTKGVQSVSPPSGGRKATATVSPSERTAALQGNYMAARAGRYLSEIGTTSSTAAAATAAATATATATTTTSNRQGGVSRSFMQHRRNVQQDFVYVVDSGHAARRSVRQ